jgi:hypothetical protein
MPSWYSSPLGPAIPGVFLLYVRAKVHARGVPPDEEGLFGLMLALDEVLSGGEGFLVDRLHALAGERPGVLDGLSALAVSLALEYAARPELFAKGLTVGELQVGRDNRDSPAPLRR